MPACRYGERIHDPGAPRYVKHPPAAAAHLANGSPLDAGSAHHVDNNVVHLAAEGARHWVWDALDGAGLVEGRGYTGYTDVSEPPATWTTGADAVTLIGWGRANSRRYGPFFAARDEIALDGTYVPRGVRCKLFCTVGSSGTFRAFAVLTRSPKPPPDNLVVAAEFTLPAANNTGVATATLRAATWPANAQPLSALCRPPGATTVRTRVRPLPLWLWLGWYVTHSSHAVLSFSAYETRA